MINSLCLIVSFMFFLSYQEFSALSRSVTIHFSILKMLSPFYFKKPPLFASFVSLHFITFKSFAIFFPKQPRLFAFFAEKSLNDITNWFGNLSFVFHFILFFHPFCLNVDIVLLSNEATEWKQKCYCQELRLVGWLVGFTTCQLLLAYSMPKSVIFFQAIIWFQLTFPIH